MPIARRATTTTKITGMIVARTAPRSLAALVAIVAAVEVDNMII